ncbi:serpentine type 7TM GPCR chemoreceptor srx domain-containing protein [Ditylenchus destructor]|uniref:Serpentine type 7TM GPCR chemoreceptor srx domain-containing protein n=1 Tax=Ditylenchus destructor TaxID=166010 RepID=A0AAD4MXZ3_9BILA|nr:serpentine type 7TM GPCR chemoreceptor srx domain-containing protein [Ditylenchus destructor]
MNDSAQSAVTLQPSEYYLLRLRPPPDNYLLLGIALFVFSAANLVIYGVVQIAVKRIATRHHTFILLFSHGIADIGFLTQMVWLSLEIIFQYRLLVPLKLDTFMLRLFGRSSNYHYLMIALNRAHSLLFPFSYTHFWNRRRSVIVSSLLCWALGTLHSIYVVYIFEVDDKARVIHMPSVLSFSLIDVTAKGGEASTRLEKILQGIVAIPTILVYIIISFGLLWTRITKSSSVKSTSTSQPRKDPEGRIRLFVICFLSTVPTAIVYVIGYVIPQTPPYGSYAASVSYVIAYSASAHFLLSISSLVRKYLPFRLTNDSVQLFTQSASHGGEIRAIRLAPPFV